MRKTRNRLNLCISDEIYDNQLMNRKFLWKSLVQLVVYPELFQPQTLLRAENFFIESCDLQISSSIAYAYSMKISRTLVPRIHRSVSANTFNQLIEISFKISTDILENGSYYDLTNRKLSYKHLEAFLDKFGSDNSVILEKCEFFCHDTHMPQKTDVPVKIDDCAYCSSKRRAFYLPRLVISWSLCWDIKSEISLEYHICTYAHLDDLNRDDRISSTRVYFENLLKKFKKFSIGHANGYEKRFIHDRLVRRELYQDMYDYAKRRYCDGGQGWVRRWRKDVLGCAQSSSSKMDPIKQVYEELAIFCFLHCLWFDCLKPRQEDFSRLKFVDLGCGNGFLTYLLTDFYHHEISEQSFFDCKDIQMRYDIPGYGIDLTSRPFAWNVFRDSCRPFCLDLREALVEPSKWVPDFYESIVQSALQKHSNQSSSCWIIGNHADELTGWIPLISARLSFLVELRVRLNLIRKQNSNPVNSDKCIYSDMKSDGFLELEPFFKFMVIPCCFHDLSGQRNPFGSTIPINYETEDTQEDGIRWPPQDRQSLSEKGSKSVPRYRAYSEWVRRLIVNEAGYRCEWEWLRIPSTKNLALIGRSWKTAENNEEECYMDDQDRNLSTLQILKKHFFWDSVCAKIFEEDETDLLELMVSIYFSTNYRYNSIKLLMNKLRKINQFIQAQNFEPRISDKLKQQMRNATKRDDKLHNKSLSKDQTFESNEEYLLSNLMLEE